MQKKTIKLTNKLGLHARASSLFIKTASRFASETTVLYQGKAADAKSIMDVMMLGAACGAELTLECEGADETQALDAMIQLIENKFGEEE